MGNLETLGVKQLVGPRILLSIRVGDSGHGVPRIDFYGLSLEYFFQYAMLTLLTLNLYSQRTKSNLNNPTWLYRDFPRGLLPTYISNLVMWRNMCFPLGTHMCWDLFHAEYHIKIDRKKPEFYRLLFSDIDSSSGLC